MTSTTALLPIPRATMVDTVVERLRTEILTRALAPGARLPAERELADKFGINRLTLRAALSRLESMGLIETQHGSGTVVRDFVRHSGLEMLPELIHVMRSADRASYVALFRDVLDLRRTVAAEALALAAERHTASDLVAIRRAMAAQADRVDDVLAFARGDFEVARRVVQAARNVGLELLLNTLVRFPLEDPALARAMYPSPPVQNQHYATVLALIESRNADKARDAMRHALETIDRATLEQMTRSTTRRTTRRKAAAR